MDESITKNSDTAQPTNKTSEYESIEPVNENSKKKFILPIIIIFVIIILGAVSFVGIKKILNPIDKEKVLDNQEILIDCGISSTGAEISLLTLDEYLADEASICFGKSIVKNCTKTQIIIRNNNGDEAKMETMGFDENGKCKLRYTELRNNENNGLSMNCIYPLNEIFDRVISEISIDKDMGDLAFALYLTSSFDTLSGKFCQGPLIDAITTQLSENITQNETSEICDKDKAIEKANELLNALKEGNLISYQDACGNNIGLCSETSFNERKNLYSNINEFTIDNIEERDDSVRIRFNEQVEVTDDFLGTFNQTIYLTYDFKGCRLNTIQG